VIEAVRITDPGALERAVGPHPYLRWTTSPAQPPTAYLGQHVTAWISAGHRGRMLCAMGDASAALALVAALRGDGRLDDVVRVHLPRTPGDLLADALGVTEANQWDFRWCRRTPDPDPGADRVEALGDADGQAVAAVLDRALPDSGARPGQAHIRAWYGIRVEGQVVACLADATRSVVGWLAGIAVLPECQGRGFGTSLTVTTTRRLMSEVDTVALGVMAGNAGAARLYHRLGFTGIEPRTSFAWPPGTRDPVVRR
jgi:ribosomal protein S18 acetylase RimI-like enzyme